jgi:hypothetical protein
MQRPECRPGRHLGLEVGGHCSICGGRIDDADRQWLGMLAIVVSTSAMAIVIAAAAWWLFFR